MKGRSDATTRPMIPPRGVQHYECVIRFRYAVTEDESGDLPWNTFTELQGHRAVSRVSDPSITRLTPEND